MTPLFKRYIGSTSAYNITPPFRPNRPGNFRKAGGREDSCKLKLRPDDSILCITQVTALDSEDNHESYEMDPNHIYRADSGSDRRTITPPECVKGVVRVDKAYDVCHSRRISSVVHLEFQSIPEPSLDDSIPNNLYTK